MNTSHNVVPTLVRTPRARAVLFCAAFCVLGIAPAYPLGPGQATQVPLSADSPAALDLFGWAVAMSDRTAIAGSGNEGDGRAFVFMDTSTEEDWSSVVRVELVPSESVTGAFFGRAVAIDGKVAVVGASEGAVAYVFVDTSALGDWSTIAQVKLTANDAQAMDGFGFAVGIDGRTIVVGAPAHQVDGVTSGALYVYQDISILGDWSSVRETQLVASDAATGDRLGHSVGVFGETVVAGSPLDDDDGDSSGSAYVFQDVSVSGDWSVAGETKLTASDAALLDTFGDAVAVQGGTVAVGASLANPQGLNSGAAYVYQDSSIAGDWSTVNERVVVPSDGAAGDLFGEAIDIFDKVLVVGASRRNTEDGVDAGSVYVFEDTSASGDWSSFSEERNEAESAVADARFGQAVACTATEAIAGAPKDDSAANEAGAVVLLVPDSTADKLAPTITIDGENCSGGTPIVEMRCASPAGDFVDYLPEATDDRDPSPAITCFPPPGGLFPLGATPVSCEAVDASGNSTICDFFVEVTDVDPPAIVCPSDVVIECSGTAGTPLDYVTDEPVDLCDVEVVEVFSPSSGTLFAVGNHTVSYQAVDGSGNEASCEFSVEVQDTTPPEFSCPEDLVVECSGAVGATVTYSTVPPSDACDPSPVEIFSPPSGSILGRGVHTVSYQVVDSAGNQAQCEFQVEVLDTTPPELVCPPDVTEMTNLGCTFAGNIGQATATDACSSGSPVTISNDAPTSFPVGKTAVTWTAVDVAGNLTTCVQNVSIIDEEGPVLTLAGPSLLSLECGGSFDDPGANAQDLCEGDLTSAVTVSGAVDTTTAGMYTLTYSIVDASGNTDTTTRTVQVSDTTPPVLECPISRTIECSGSSTAVDFDVSVTDACDAAPTVVYSPPAGTAFGLGTHLVTCTATDASGNSSLCTFTVTVIDTSPPEIICPQTISVPMDGNCQYQGPIGSPAVSDNCSSFDEVTITSDAPDIFAVGTTLVTWRAIDAAGNSGSCVQVVTVEDNVSPTVTLIGPAVVTLECGQEFQDPGATAADGCAGDLSASVTVAGTVDHFAVGNYALAYIAVDRGGNVATAQRTVRIIDMTAPTITCPESLTVECVSGGETVVDFEATVLDSCDANPTIQYEPAPGTSLGLGTHTVVCVASDASGNSDSCSFVIEVVDSSAPELSGPERIDLDANLGCLYIGDLPPPSIVDNCSGAEEVTLTSNAPSTFGEGSTTEVTWTATDASGNFATITQRVVISDQGAPVLTVQGEPLMTVQCGGEFVDPGATAIDGCGGDLTDTIQVVNSVNTEILGSYGVDYRVTDAAGNTVIGTRTVNVVDTTGPVIDCPEPIFLPCPGVGQTVTVEYSASARDACGGAAIVTIDPPSGTAFGGGLHPVTVTATDFFANTSTCTFFVIVECGLMLPGDCNPDGSLDISDGICLLEKLFLDPTPNLPCGDGSLGSISNQRLLDSDGNGAVEITDSIYVFRFLFLGGPEPVLGRECATITGCPDSCLR